MTKNIQDNRQDNRQQIIKTAQDRKDLSIAFFNATNSAIEMLKVWAPNSTEKEARAKIAEWRNWFLDEHGIYRNEILSKVGQYYDPESTLQKLKNVKSMEELKDLWKSLSEDERHDDNVILLKDKLKEKYANK